MAVGLNLMAIQQAIDEGIEVRDDGLKLACTVSVTGAYLYFSWWFFSRPIRVATPGLGVGVPGCSGEEEGDGRESLVADDSKTSNPDDAEHVTNGEELPGAWSSSPGIGFFLGGIGSAGILPGGGVAGDGNGGWRRSSVAMGVAAAVLLAVCVQSYREAGDFRCLLDHVGVVVGEGCDIPALRGRAMDTVGRGWTLETGAGGGGAAGAAGEAAAAMLSSALDAVDGNPIQQL